MRVLLQRVSRASVTVDGEVVGAIERGFLLLVGATASDTEADLDYLADKIANLRVFPDDAGAMNRSALDLLAAPGSDIGMLVVSQFTLYADVRKGRRPSFTGAAPPDLAAPLVAGLAERLRQRGFPVAEGRVRGDDGRRAGQRWPGDDLARHGRPDDQYLDHRSPPG